MGHPQSDFILLVRLQKRRKKEKQSAREKKGRVCPKVEYFPLLFGFTF
jgi:hypothetical protein